ncbi:hypothetical protein HDV06_001438 [Boothiomyces sp. JEL0866]|nr:hypothetical protein HDV06_001438 [Boothiomyces sp. JEL0866]
MSGAQKVLLKLRKNVQDGDYYEAYQMYHSVSQRFVKQKKQDQAVQLLMDGIKTMNQYNQHASALDLAERLMELYAAPNTDAIAHLAQVFYTFPLDSAQCDLFIKNVLKWSNNDSNLNHVFGCRYAKEGQYYNAETHLMNGTLDSIKVLAEMELEFSKLGYKDDVGYYIARACLPLLVLGKYSEAKSCMEQFTAGLNADCLVENVQDTPVSTHKLFNFTHLLIAAIGRNQGQLFSTIVNSYQSELSFDSFLTECVAQIGKVYFGIGLKQKQSNPFAEMMKNMLNPTPQLQIAEDLDMD